MQNYQKEHITQRKTSQNFYINLTHRNNDDNDKKLIQKQNQNHNIHNQNNNQNNNQNYQNLNNLSLKSQIEFVKSRSDDKKMRYFSDKALYNLQKFDQELKRNVQNKNVMRVIKGGGKKTNEKTEKTEKKFFFEKLISNKNIQFLNDKEKAPLSSRRDYEKIIQEKYENQMKLLTNTNEEDEDEFNNSSGFNSEDD